MPAETTLTRAGLAIAVYRRLGISRLESGQLIDQLFEQIADALSAGEDVKISSFGAFRIRHKGARIGRNPKTLQDTPIPPRSVLVFRASQLLKQRIDEGMSRSEEP